MSYSLTLFQFTLLPHPRHIPETKDILRQRMNLVCRANTAHDLFLYSPWAKNGFYTFKWLKNFLCVKCENYEVQTSSSINNILLGHSYVPLFILYSRREVWTEAHVALSYSTQLLGEPLISNSVIPYAPWITVAYCYFYSHYQCILFMSEQEEKGENRDYACLLLRHSRRWIILSNEVAKHITMQWY